MRTRLVLAALLLSTPGLLAAQDCGPDWKSGTGSASPYWLVVDGLNASRHSNLATGLRALKDTLSARPDAAVRLRADFEAVWLGPCAGEGVDTVVVTDTVEVELPPDTAAVSMPTSVSLMGYAAPDMLHPREHGLHVEWDNAPVDRWVVRGGRNDSGEAWGPVAVTNPSYRHELPASEPEGDMWTCVTAEVGGRPASENACTGFPWSPIRYGQYEAILFAGSEPLAPGDSVNIDLSRVDGGWADGSVARPDSVVFETGTVRVREQVFPYRFPNDDDLFAVPAGDSLIVTWDVFSGTGMQGGSVAYPLTP